MQLLSQVQPQICVDYQRSPPRLVEGCLVPFQLDLAVSFGDVANPIAAVTGLPNHRFIRFAYLTVSDEGFNPPAQERSENDEGDVATARSPRQSVDQSGWHVSSRTIHSTCRHATRRCGSCRQASCSIGSASSERCAASTAGIAQSCVANGDNSPPGAPDDRAAVMTPLTPMTEEVVPYAMKIMPDYL
jgi:hypothetical protein